MGLPSASPPRPHHFGGTFPSDCCWTQSIPCSNDVVIRISAAPTREAAHTSLPTLKTASLRSAQREAQRGCLGSAICLYFRSESWPSEAPLVAMVSQVRSAMVSEEGQIVVRPSPCSLGQDRRNVSPPAAMPLSPQVLELLHQGKEAGAERRGEVSPGAWP